jgi:putative endopeptidase
MKEGYLKHIAKMFVNIGQTEAEAAKNAAVVMALETEIAKVSMDRVEMRDPYKTYNKLSVAGFSELSQGIEWSKMLSLMNVNWKDSILVSTPGFFTGIGSLIQKQPLENWKTYLRWHIIHSAAPYLTSSIVNDNFEFYGKTMRGQKEMTPRWKRVLRMVDGSIGELLGQTYVSRYFKPEAKNRMMELVTNLEKAYESRINKLDWMTPTTKVKALGKLHAFIRKIGYPDKWKDYSAISITADNYFQNIQNCGAWAYNDMIGKLGKTVDKSEWLMTPPTVNAYYNPTMNEIVFPAGILQFPFFAAEADDAVNYGGIGAVIGHEMTHGFDDQGAQYDLTGKLNNWWLPEDSSKFATKTQSVVKQYNNYKILDTIAVNGELTLGENIADLGGIMISYEAFKMTKQGKSTTKIDGFTPDQRFFMSWAQVWRQNITPQEAQQRIVTDPHSPGVHRCNGPITNFEPWYKAFNVKPTNKMYVAEKDRIKVW